MPKILSALGIGTKAYRLGGVIFSQYNIPEHQGRLITGVMRDYFCLLYLPVIPLRMAARSTDDLRLDLDAASMCGLNFCQWEWAQNSSRARGKAWLYSYRANDTLARSVAIVGALSGASAGGWLGLAWLGAAGLLIVLPGALVGAGFLNRLFIALINGAIG